jgi:hypothetical protein
MMTEDRHDETFGPLVDSEPSGVREAIRRGRYLIAALVVPSVAWVVLFVVRLQAHQANVDDYSYALLARQLSHSGDVFDTGHNGPLVIALAAPGARIGGIYGALAVELPILIVLLVGTFVLTRTWLSPTAAMVTTLVVGLNEAVMGYSVMLNFALAVTAALIWSFTAYLRSERLTDMRWSLAFGISVAALLLARSVSPIYVVPLATVILFDLVRAGRKNKVHLGRPAVVALGIVLVVAGPWWLVSGPAVAHYLINSGYQPSSGQASHGLELTPESIIQRAKWELSYLGWAQSLLLGAAAVAATAALLLRRWSMNLERAWILGVWAALTFLILATSSNSGTAFGLPVLVTIVILCAVILGQLPTRLISPFVAVVGVCLIIGVVAQGSSSNNPWWPGPPYRAQVLDAGGTKRTNTDLLASNVAAQVRTGRTLLDRDDPILSWSGLAWNDVHLVRPQSTRAAIRELSKARNLITGTSVLTFDPFIDQRAIEIAAYDEGFRPQRSWVVSAGDSVVIWHRGSSPGTYDAPRTAVLIPTRNAQLRGTVLLDAGVVDPAGDLSVRFVIAGDTLKDDVSIQAQSTYYGWLARWNTAEVADGLHTIESVVESFDGKLSRSPAIPVWVHN